MAGESLAYFSCPSCGAKHPWYPKIAGVLIVCRCGKGMTAPRTAGDAVGEGDNGPETRTDAAPSGFARPAVAATANANPAATLQGATRPIGAAPAKAPSVHAPASPPLSPANATGAEGVCPACGAVVAYTATECPRCGYRPRIDLEGVVAVEADLLPAESPPAKPRRVRSLARRELTIPLLIMLGGLFALGIMCTRTNPHSAGTRLDDDAAVEKMYQKEKGFEVIQWLQNNPKHVLAGLSIEAAPKFILDLYDLGAVSVTAFGDSTADVLAIELPPDKDKRQKLIDWDARWEADKGVPPTTDVGQKYILVHMVGEASAGAKQ
jgi:predicted RNA-binding Zn-ribbon protein involved in translation (DUF1610 family)